MTNDAVGKISLDIFGAVMASISHEVKNRMAVINEHAGLIEDHINIAERAEEINIDRFRQSAEKIKLQVEIANEIIKNMNRFAHSVDNTAGQVNLHDAATLVSSLFQRKASAHQVSIDVRPPNEPVIEKRPFYHVLGLIWICLEAVAAIAAANSMVTISTERHDGESRLIIGFDTAAEGGPDNKIPETAQILAKSINADVILDQNQNNFVLRFF